jgi:erythromycin esterase-like protein
VPKSPIPDFLCAAVLRLTKKASLDPLLDLAGNASFVLLGEASHGTHEFYSKRAEIAKRLIREKGFHAVAVEADWPDAHRVIRYVRGRSNDANSLRAISGFARFPVRM